MSPYCVTGSGFVTIQNNILLKPPKIAPERPMSFVTIQNNILLKLYASIVPPAVCFVTIQNNILLKQIG